MNYLLLFHLQLSSSNDLIPGRLLLINKDADTIENIYAASSGLPGYQTRDNLTTVGKGAIPPHNEVGLQHYTVATNPEYEPNVVGVEGNFYAITPTTVTIQGVERGEFGVHFDANVPGTSGCIGLRTHIGFNAFEADMKKIQGLGVTEIPLLISYTTGN